MGFFEMFRDEILSSDTAARLWELFFAFILSSIIGLEREFRLKAAGLRTHALVGLGAAVMMLVSKFGFSDLDMPFDPSRVAAQIVSGIGFIGAGLIFVRKDIVHGLTTAATIWLTAGVGMACGGGLPFLAMAATAGHFVIAFGYTWVMHRIFGVTNRLIVRYRRVPSGETSARILAACTDNDFVIRSFSMKEEFGSDDILSLMLRVQGSKSVELLSERLLALPGVVQVKVNVTKEE